MTTYIVKRLLLMIPTMFMVVLLTFIILNVAPGNPAQMQMSSQGTESSTSQESRESYRIFKQQFNLDKPIVFNTRFGLDQTDVAEELEILADSKRPTCPKDEGAEAPPNCIEEEEEPGSGDVIDAQEQLSDWGDYIVPELYEVARGHDRLDVRRLAVNQLKINAQGELINQYGERLTDEQQKHNERVSAMNERIKKWGVAADASAEKISKVLEEKWGPWIDKPEQQKRFDMSGFGERAWRFAFDTRFAKYMYNLLTADFGVSHMTKQPVIKTLWERVKYTIGLTFPALVLAFFISVPIGVWSATQRQTWFDQGVTTGLLILYSLPTFFTGILLLEFFAAGDPFKWFPIGGFVGEGAEQMTTLQYLKSVSWHLFLPVVCLTYPRFAGLSRYARTGIVDVIESDYIRTARAKGLPESMVIMKHAVRNGMIPTLTILGTQLPRLVGGSIVIEYVFEIPGMGMYLLESIHNQDYNALMAILVVSALLTLIGILISDISYALVDPRISFD